MTEEHSHHECKTHRNDRWYDVGKWGAIAIILYYLITQHKAHVWEYLPFAFLLLCPLMHFFMHGSHHHGGHSKEKIDKQGSL